MYQVRRTGYGTQSAAHTTEYGVVLVHDKRVQQCTQHGVPSISAEYRVQATPYLVHSSIRVPAERTRYGIPGTQQYQSSRRAYQVRRTWYTWCTFIGVQSFMYPINPVDRKFKNDNSLQQ